MLQVYHRQTRIKPFAPKLTDQCLKRWDSHISLPTNISLLSVSDESENVLDIGENIDDNYSLSSQEGKSSVHHESPQSTTKRTGPDEYILNKHLYGIPSTISNLDGKSRDQSANELFEEEKSFFREQNDDFDPRSIRPPSFSNYIQQMKESRIKINTAQRRSARVPIRTTKAEQLKLARKQSARENAPSLPNVRSIANKSQAATTYRSYTRQSTTTSMSRVVRSRPASISTFKQSESTRTCRHALRSNDPLTLSPMLTKQMREDIQSNRAPAYSKPLNSALLREQSHLQLDQHYKMRRVHEWLKTVTILDYIEYNEHASNETITATNSVDKFDNEYDLLADEKLPINTERTNQEIHRVLPLFKNEISRQLQQRNLLLTRIELDLYVM